MRTASIAAIAAALAVSACAPRSTELLTPTLATTCEGAALDRPLVMANYNIKSGMWTSLDQVAEVIGALDADVIALQEVDDGMNRTDGVDQSQVLAEQIGAERIFAGAIERDGGHYGIALLSKLPVLKADRVDLPDAGGAEPRVAIDAELCAGSEALRVVGSHFDFTPWAAEAHAKALKERIGDDDDVVVMGDFNLPPDNVSVQALIQQPLQDALAMFDEGPTFADVRIDYILTDRALQGAEIVESYASDHNAVKASLDLVKGLVP